MTSDAPEIIEVPSGQQVTLLDVIHNEPGADGATVRFRFLAPQIAPGPGMMDFDVSTIDMKHLCDTYALPRVAGNVPAPLQIIISFSDREVAFGEADPDATQFFEAYSIEAGECVWEPF
jgi:hypothetical protein